MPHPPPTSDATSPAELAAAQAALAQQRWQDAAALCRQLLQQPLPPGVRARGGLTLARACWHQGELVDSCREALQADRLALEAGDRATMISAATLAAFALCELGLEAQALPLATRALADAQRPELYLLLPTALSCAAHVHARLGDLAQAEGLHMRALSHARDSGDTKALQLACDNLLLSFILLHRSAPPGSDTAQLAQRAQRHLGQVRHLIDNPALEEWRRISLMLNLGELLGLGGEPVPGRELMERGIARARQLAAGYSTLVAQTALAELLCRAGEFEAVLACLGDSLTAPQTGAGYLRRMRGLQVAQISLRALGRDAEADALALRMDDARQAHLRMQQAVRASLQPAAVENSV